MCELQMAHSKHPRHEITMVTAGAGDPAHVVHFQVIVCVATDG